MYLEQEEGRNEMLVENAPDVTGEVIPADRVDEDEDAPEVEEPEEADGDDAGPLLAAPVTIGALCSMYHVNKEWLDTNEGEMYIDVYKPGDSLGELISLEEVLLRELKGIVFD